MNFMNFEEVMIELNFESFLEIENKLSKLESTIVNTRYLKVFGLTNEFFKLRSSNCIQEYSNLKNLLDRQGGKSLDQ